MGCSYNLILETDGKYCDPREEQLDLPPVRNKSRIYLNFVIQEKFDF